MNILPKLFLVSKPCLIAEDLSFFTAAPTQMGGFYNGYDDLLSPTLLRAPLEDPRGLSKFMLNNISEARPFCDAIFLKKFLRLSPDQRSFLTKVRTVLAVIIPSRQKKNGNIFDLF